ncbi:expressed unknown protein [Seminavis robusta]|uniref:CRAL-TRIO domain-containing protein n=1 Tax=Seminavis robusta TaxID=568900 RepID=A0A9N8H5K6_9STRA|nr:expressed unknown protein [Seminavis robusta]|eukprot:Sro76_g041770.1 n/a (348) ;mRNA; f:111632-112675
MQAAAENEHVRRHDDGSSNQGPPLVPDGMDRQPEVVAAGANAEAVAVNAYGANDQNNREMETEDNEYESDSSESGSSESDSRESEEDYSRMQLTDEERQWALNVKQAIEDDPELDSVSDFWVAQLALIEQGDTEAALERAHQMQSFRQEYGILDTYEHGKQVLHEFMDLFPEFFLSFSFLDGAYVLVFDTAKLYANTLNTKPGAMAAWLGSVYYTNHCMSPDLEAVKRGIVYIIECEGFDWSKHFGVQIFRKFWLEVAAVYPIQFLRIRCFHTGLCLTLMVSMVKHILPAKIHSKFTVGNICSLGRLDTVYNSAGGDFTRDVLKQRMKQRLEESLLRRYRLEASFSL